MSLTTQILEIVVIIWTFLYIISYGKWTWKDNKLGAIMVFLLGIITVALPVATILIRG